MTKWEYATLALTSTTDDYYVTPPGVGPNVQGVKIYEALDAFGATGWELIHVDTKVYIFKRPKD